MRIAIAGGTDFIGQALSSWWQSQGHEIVIITRSPKTSQGQQNIHQLSWDQALINPDRLGKLEAIVNLAGAPINQRWTDKAKKQIMESRLQTVHKTAELIHRLESALLNL
ncbi:NAD-dependent epimerase/dehydratase family protein [Paenibacillus caui]|uniref:NAD-dependent epimerase/dehydratase family protein n=1 Tax=Paenibacillus caui TaxID=2873927 RepID=UPI001CA7CC86